MWYLVAFVIGAVAHWGVQEAYYRWIGFQGNVILFPERVLAIRDAMVEEDAHEAYHQLSEAVAETGDRKYDPYKPWAHIEKEADDVEK